MSRYQSENLVNVIKNVKKTTTQGTVSLNRFERLMQISQVIMQYMSAGRASEVGLVLWDSAFFNFDEQVLQVTWIESKTSSQKMMSFCNHKESYDLCPFFSFFMYMISGMGISVHFEKQCVFPSLTPSNAAATITKILRSGLTNVTGVQKDLSSKDLRYSAANTMLLNAGIEVCVALGGSDIEVMTDRKTGAMYVYILVLFI